jgi:adenosylmethionine-8-amino-7-oxononanoate aminotransferase
MAVCDPETGMHHLFTQALTQQFFAEAPSVVRDEDWQDSDIASFRSLIETHHDEIAAVILEPIVQGAGGMRFYAPEYLRQVRALCDKFKVLLIADEIATGFGRTGKMFACEHAGISPDIICLGKAITGGYLSLAAVLTTAEISRTISTNPPGAFMHGPTFMANPLACAIANASIDLLLDSPWQERISAMTEAFANHLQPCLAWDGVLDVRWIGGIGVLELEQPVNLATITRRFVDKGIWIRPFGRLVYVMPPYVIDEKELETLLSALTQTVAEEIMGR